ncbi:unnamed protein product [Adineta steineri]|uniref:G-protein coupled receptors family 1 profile domain-containing protein n=1 Tax=Adineta steineri TaxID=433720 RepID=A0A815CE00_9BILA|nr:unnamed protein product [Adineta steineri]CAF1285947.1 unnamed protein product [Adineta steineri]
MSLLYISQQLIFYGGIFLILVGMFGNGMNVLIFSSIRSYRTNPSTFYFLVGSIDNILYIVINLISRIVATGGGIDLTRTSIVWCKIRPFFVSTLPLINLTCSCLATIDQFLITSKHVKIRRCSNIKWAHKIVLCFIIIWCLHGIPILIFYEISSITQTCGNTNAAYGIYIIIYLLGLVTSIPAILMVFFGYLAYRNIHMTRNLNRQDVDRQLMRMTLFQVLLNIVCIVHYGINNLYSLITSGVSKGADRLQMEYFISTILTLLTYGYFTGSCYMFWISSSRFRKATKDRICFWRRQNQINPLPTITYGRTAFEMKTQS